MAGSAHLSPGDKIPLTAAQREALGAQARDVCMDLEAQHANYIHNIRVWWDWYNAKPDVTVRDTPWRGASNMVVPFIRSQADSLSSRAILTVFSGERIWHHGTIHNDFFRDRADAWLDYLNYQAWHPFSMFQPVEGAINEQYVIGESVMHSRWSRRERFIVPPNDPGDPIKVSYGESPETIHTPREQVLWPRGVPIREADVIARQVFMSGVSFLRQATLDGWDQAAVETALKERGITGPVADVYQARQEAIGAATDASGQFSPYDVREVWIDWKMVQSLDSRAFKSVPNISHILDVAVGDEVTVPAVLTIHRGTGALLDARYSPYLTPDWPFYELHYRRLSGPSHGSHGIAKIGEHIQRGMTTIINQSIDSVTLANAMKIITTDKDFANRPFVPNQVSLVKDTSDGAVRELNTQKQILPDVNIINLLQAFGERTIGQSDPLLGRESRSGGHPSPATNFLGMLQQGQILNTRPMKSVRIALGQMAEDRSIMAQQFEKNPGGWLGQVFDDDDAAKVLDIVKAPLPAPGHMRFDVRALSETHSPDAERQKSLVVYQVQKDYHATVMQHLAILKDETASPDMKELSAQAVNTLGLSMQRTLENSDIDDVQEYVFQLRQAREADTAQLGALASAVNERFGPGGAAIQPPTAANGAAPGVPSVQ